MEQAESEGVVDIKSISEPQAKCVTKSSTLADLQYVNLSGENKQMEETFSLDPMEATKITKEITNERSEKTEMTLVTDVLFQHPMKMKTDDKIDRSFKSSKSTLTTECFERVDEVGLQATQSNDEEQEFLHQRMKFDQQIEQLTAALVQKDNIIALYERENSLLEKEKQAFRKEKELANKEKESTVIKFAIKEKLLLDAKKEKDLVEKQLADARKEIKNVTARFHAINEEKSRMSYIIEEKWNEVRKYQREREKLKSDYSHLESKLKYHINKLNIETEAKLTLESKLEEERNAPNRLEEKTLEKLKVEHEANTILLRHEIENKTEHIEALTKENKRLIETIMELREQLNQSISEKNEAIECFEALQIEHTCVQGALSDEMLNSAKLRGQLEELQLLRTQNALNEDKICNLKEKNQQLEEAIEFNSQDLQELRSKELELLSTNKEVSESLVNLQNEMCTLSARLRGTMAENELLKKERVDYEAKYELLEQTLQKEIQQKSEERQLLTKHLSEKTKLYETTKLKLENLLGDFEATTHKHATVVKELQREIQKHKKLTQQMPNLSDSTMSHAATGFTEKALHYHSDFHHRGFNGKSFQYEHSSLKDSESSTQSRPLSQNSSCNQSSNGRVSEASDAETTVANSNKNVIAIPALSDGTKGPSKKHLVERILRLQQAAARQTEKIDFLENHTLALVAELQKKSKVVQYYMLRDQAGALTSTKSDQHKSELSKYGNGVMSAIYGGIKAENKSMTLDLSLEINKKLQAVLEDTLLKNITLKENLDVLGLEVDNLTRKLRFLEIKE